MSDLTSLYEGLILEHSRGRHGYGLRPSADASSHQLNPTCGDEVTLQLHLDRADGVAVSWEGHGCLISTASASILTELAEGVPVSDLADVIERFRELMHSRGAGVPDEAVLGDAAALAGVSRYPMRVKCAMLPWVACEAALAQLPRSGSGSDAASQGSGRPAG